MCYSSVGVKTSSFEFESRTIHMLLSPQQDQDHENMVKENVDCPTSFKYGVGPLNIRLFVLLWTLKHKDGKYGLGLEGQNNENMVLNLDTKTKTMFLQSYIFTVIYFSYIYI